MAAPLFVNFFPVNPALVGPPNPAWVRDGLQGNPRFRLELDQECLSCLSGRCERHDYRDHRLAIAIERRRPSEQAIELLRRWETLNPDVARMVLEHLPPMTFYSIIEVEPFKSICPNDTGYVGGLDYYEKAKTIFPAGEAPRSSAPYGLLFGPAATLRYKYIFWDRMTTLTFEIGLYLHEVLDYPDAFIPHYHKLIWHLWRIFGNTPAIPAASAAQEPFNYFASLPPDLKNTLVWTLRALGAHFLAAFPLTWPPQLCLPWHAELEANPFVKLDLARFRAIEWLRVGMGRALRAFNGPRPKPLRLHKAFGLRKRGVRPSPYPELVWENDRHPDRYMHLRMSHPGDVVAVDECSYRVRFVGRPGTSAVTGLPLGHIELIAPEVDLYYALRFAARARDQNGREVTLDWDVWSTTFPPGTVIRRHNRPVV